MTPEQQWLLLVVSNAPIKSVEEAEYKAHNLLQIAAKMRAENEVSDTPADPE